MLLCMRGWSIANQSGFWEAFILHNPPSRLGFHPDKFRYESWHSFDSPDAATGCHASSWSGEPRGVPMASRASTRWSSIAESKIMNQLQCLLRHTSVQYCGRRMMLRGVVEGKLSPDFKRTYRFGRRDPLILSARSLYSSSIEHYLTARDREPILKMWKVTDVSI